MELLRGLQRGATLCVVTHDPRYATQADRSIELFVGRLARESRAEWRANSQTLGRRLSPRCPPDHQTNAPTTNTRAAGDGARSADVLTLTV